MGKVSFFIGDDTTTPLNLSTIQKPILRFDKVYNINSTSNKNFIYKEESQHSSITFIGIEKIFSYWKKLF
jgi:hypothetical protein